LSSTATFLAVFDACALFVLVDVELPETGAFFVSAFFVSIGCWDLVTSPPPSLNFRKRRRSASTFSAALAKASRGSGFVLSGNGSSNASKFSSPSSNDPLVPITAAAESR